MHAERDYLRAHVFPELAHRLRARFHHLEIIDLRQGIETADIDAQANRDLEVLQVCLREIERSHPFFIGLIGDRYGWIPPRERIQAAIKEAGYRGNIDGISVTELEFLYGALEAEESDLKAWFYLRDPLQYDAMPTELAESYRTLVEDDSTASNEQLARLKQRLRTDPRTRDRVRTYSATWEHASNRIAPESLKAWGDQVLEDLWRDLKEETAAHVQSSPATWQEVDRELLESFVDDRLTEFVGRVDCTKRLVEHALQEKSEEAAWAIHVRGEPGSGKSSLFGKVYGELLQEDELVVLAHAAGIFAESDSIERMQRRWIYELGQIEKALNDQGRAATELTTQDDVDAEFARLLHEVSQVRRIVIMVDALNQFSDSQKATSLTWLPLVVPGGVRVIVTSLSKFTGGHIHENVEMMNLPPFSVEEGKSFAKLVHQRYHRQPNEQALAALFAKERIKGELASGNPLWLRLALDSLNLMEGDDFVRAEKEFAPLPAHARMHALVAQEAAQFPAVLAPAFVWMLERTERHFGSRWVRALLELIAISRNGWRQSDLEELVSRVSGEPWSDLKFAGARRFLGSHLVQRGVNASWTFLHEQLREAVLERSSSTTDRRLTLHRRIAHHLLSLPKDDEVRQSETMYHLLGTNDQVLAAKFVASLDDDDPALPYAVASIADHCVSGSTVELWAGDSHQLEEDGQLEELCEVLQGVPELFGDIANDPSFGSARGTKIRLDTSTNTRFVTSMLDVESLSHDEIIQIAFILQNELRVKSGGVRQILQSCKPAIERVLAENPNHCRAWAELFRNKYLFGLVLLTQGSTDDAWVMLNEAHHVVLSIPDDRIRDSIEEHLADCLSTMASAEMRMRRIPDALSHQQEAIERLDHLRKKGTLSKDGFDSLIDTTFEHGDVLAESGKVEDARRTYKQAAALLEDYPGGEIQRSYNVALSSDKQGNLFLRDGDYENALVQYQGSLDVSEELLRGNPLGPNAMHRVGVSQAKVANALMGLGRYHDAVEACQRCVALSERVINSDRASFSFRKQNAVDRGRLGQALIGAKRFEEALAQNNEVVGILDGWVETDPKNIGIRERLVQAHNQGCLIHQKLGNNDEAARCYAQGLLAELQIAALAGMQEKDAKLLVEKALPLARQLVGQGDEKLTLELLRTCLSLFAEDDLPPSEVQLQFNLGLCHQRIAEVLEAQDSWQDACAAYDLARQKLLTVATLTAQEVPVQSYLSATKKWLELCRRQYLGGDESHVTAHQLCCDYVALGDNWKNQNEPDQALPCFESALSIANMELEKENDVRDFARSSSVALERMGDCLMMKNDFSGAADCYSRCATLRKKIDQEFSDPESKTMLGLALDRWGSTAAARNADEQALSLHDTAIALFQRVISEAGYQYDDMNVLHYLGTAYLNIAARNRKLNPTEMIDNMLVCFVIMEFLEAEGYPISAEVKARLSYVQKAIDQGVLKPEFLQNSRTLVYAQLGIPQENRNRARFQN